MANINVSKNVSLKVESEEKEVLQKAHDILEDVRHQWFVADDDAWDDEDYWTLESSVRMLERLFGCTKDKKEK